MRGRRGEGEVPTAVRSGTTTGGGVREVKGTCERLGEIDDLSVKGPTPTPSRRRQDRHSVTPTQTSPSPVDTVRTSGSPVVHCAYVSLRMWTHTSYTYRNVYVPWTPSVDTSVHRPGRTPCVCACVCVCMRVQVAVLPSVDSETSLLPPLSESPWTGLPSGPCTVPGFSRSLKWVRQWSGLRHTRGPRRCRVLCYWDLGDRHPGRPFGP